MKKYSFIVDSVEVGDPTQAGTGYVLSSTKIDLTRLNNTGDSAKIVLSPNVTSILVPGVGQTVVISRGVTTAYEKYKFRGQVKQVEYVDNKYVLTCKNNLHSLKYKLLTISYDINNDVEAGELSAIFSDIVTRGGLVPSVVASGTGASDITMQKFVSNKKTYLDRLNLISTILNWTFYENYDDELIRLEPKGYEVFGTVLNVGTTIYNLPKWNDNIEDMRNIITVEGLFEEDTDIITDTGDGVSSVFSFGYTPLITDLKVNDVLMVRGIPGLTEVYDYSVDVDLKTFTFVSGSIPANTESIVMSYTHKILSSVKGKNQSRIDTNNVEQEDNFHFDDILTTDDAETRLSQLLELLSNSTINTTIHVNLEGILPGYKVTINDVNQSKYNGDYIVESVVINYPSEHDIIKIGTPKYDVNSLFATIREKLEALKGKAIDVNEIIRQLIEVYHTIIIERNNLTGEKRSKGLSFIFDDPESEFDDGVHLFDWQGSAYSDFVNEDY